MTDTNTCSNFGGKWVSLPLKKTKKNDSLIITEHRKSFQMAPTFFGCCCLTVTKVMIAKTKIEICRNKQSKQTMKCSGLKWQNVFLLKKIECKATGNAVCTLQLYIHGHCIKARK